MAIFTKQVFDSPYVVLGNENDICEVCKKKLIEENKNTPIADYPWMITMKLRGKLAGQKVFKLFQNSNTPLIICKEHMNEINTVLQEEE